MYFGSVRFFRHLLITVLMLLIAIPVIIAINYGIKYNETSSKLAEVQDIVKKYDKTGQNELVDNLTKLLDNSFDTQIPAFQQQVDDTVEEQISTLQIQLNDSLKIQMSELQTKIDDSLASNTAAINDQQSTIQQQLSSLIKSQSASVQKNLEKKLNGATTEMILQFNESLTDQVALLQQQIDELKGSEGGNG